MKTKMMLLGALMILTCTNAFSQSKTTFGVRAGVNFHNINGKDGSGDKLENKITTGFNAGVNAEIPVGIDFYLQPGVLFTTKGADEVFNSENKVTLSYIEVPINFLYKPDLGTGKLLLGFGPYVGFGIGGKYKIANGGTRDVKFQSEVTTAEAIAGQYAFFKGFDAGANMLFGYEWANNFSVQLNAGLGLVNIYPPVENIDPGKTSWKNTGFGLSLGYRFGK
ncbi:MAG: porin family protein [Chitinophagaceae bacterium]